MNFEHMEIKDINKKYKLELKEVQTDNLNFYESLFSELKNNENINYFSISFDKKDIIDDIESIEKNKFKLNLIEVDNVYIILKLN